MRKFGETIRRFAAIGGPRETTCLRLLEELSRSDDSFLSLLELRDFKPDMASGITRFLNSGWMSRLYENHPDSRNHLYFNGQYSTLVVDDPQLTFYLSRLPLSQLAREVGKAPTRERQRIFISYSHKDSEWLDRVQVHLRPLVREGIIDPWSDTRIAPGGRWRDEIQSALETATAAILLVSADYLASDFVVEHELPTLLSRAQSEGTTILPVILSPCRFSGSELGRFQAVNDPRKPLLGMPFVEQENIWRQMTEEIEKRFTNG